jgi:hypothetical protein
MCKNKGGKNMKKTRICAMILATILTLALVCTIFTHPAYATAATTTKEATTSYFTTTVESTSMLTSDNKVNAIDFVPLYNQRDYDDVPYGKYGTVSSHGCGIACLAMVYSYMSDEVHLPDELAKKFGKFNTKDGSVWALFPESAEKLNLPLLESDSPNGEWYDWKKVKAALQNGQPVICLQRKGIFTGGGHYIVLTGITEDGKILVNDPNGRNWTKNSTLEKGFDEGFTPKQIRAAGVAYWIYGEKLESDPTPEVEGAKTSDMPDVMRGENTENVEEFSTAFLRFNLRIFKEFKFQVYHSVLQDIIEDANKAQ